VVTAINENYKVQAGIDDDDGPCVEPAGGEQQAGQRYAVFTDDHDAVARADPQLPQRIGRCGHRSIELPIGQGLAVLDKRDAIGRRRDVVIEHLMDAIWQTCENAGRRGSSLCLLRCHQ